MEDQHVSFEVAKLLKERGFSEFCDWGFNPEGEIIDLDYQNGHFNANLPGEWCTRPTQSLAQRWIRENHKIHTAVYRSNNKWLSQLYSISEVCYLTKYVLHETYEEALEANLKEALKNYVSKED